MLGLVRLSVILCTVDLRAPLSMGFLRQENWRGLPIPSPGDLLHPGLNLHLLHWQVESLSLVPPEETYRDVENLWNPRNELWSVQLCALAFQSLGRTLGVGISHVIATWERCGTLRSSVGHMSHMLLQGTQNWKLHSILGKRDKKVSLFTCHL